MREWDRPIASQCYYENCFDLQVPEKWSWDPQVCLDHTLKTAVLEFLKNTTSWISNSTLQFCGQCSRQPHWKKQTAFLVTLDLLLCLFYFSFIAFHQLGLIPIIHPCWTYSTMTKKKTSLKNPCLADSFPNLLLSITYIRGRNSKFPVGQCIWKYAFSLMLQCYPHFHLKANSFGIGYFFELIFNYPVQCLLFVSLPIKSPVVILISNLSSGSAPSRGIFVAPVCFLEVLWC